MKKKKGLKISIMTLLTVCLLSLGTGSASANLANYESEPNNNYETADTAIPYNWDFGVNYGYIGYDYDVDFWHLTSSVSNSYEIRLVSPSGGYNYDFVVMEKINDGYVEVARSNAGLNQEDKVTVPGIKAGGVVPDYYIIVYDSYGGIVNTNEKPYLLVIIPS